MEDKYWAFLLAGAVAFAALVERAMSIPSKEAATFRAKVRKVCLIGILPCVVALAWLQQQMSTESGQRTEKNFGEVKAGQKEAKGISQDIKRDTGELNDKSDRIERNTNDLKVDSEKIIEQGDSIKESIDKLATNTLGQYEYGWVKFYPSDINSAEVTFHAVNGKKLWFDARKMKVYYKYENGLSSLSVGHIYMELVHEKVNPRTGGQPTISGNFAETVTVQLPLKVGEKKRLPMILGGRVRLVVEVLDDDPVEPMFAIGFDAIKSGDPSVGLLIE